MVECGTVALDELVRNTSRLVSLPDLYFRLEAAINDPQSSSHHIAEVIRHDVDLTARLLKLVNSAFYGFPGQIDSISRAMTIIGTTQLRDLALATIVMQQFEGIDHDKVSMVSFWQHSIAVGVAARNIAILRREADVERFFLMGVVHDIGRLVMLMQIPGAMSQAIQQAADNQSFLYAEEKQLCAYDHAEVGAALFKEWKLPLVLQEAAAYHHYPEHAREYRLEAAAIHLADIIVESMQLGSSGERFVSPLSEAAWNLLGLNTEHLDTVFQRTEQDVGVMLQTLMPDAIT